MDIFVLVLSVVVLLFSFVVIFGAPYVPTLRSNMMAAFDLLALKPGETLIEVGSGDGRMLLEAARRGHRAVGYELNPILVALSRWRTRKYGDSVQVVWGNAFAKQWPEAQGVYVFGVAFVMLKLYKKITQEIDHPIKVVSFGFEFADIEKVSTKNGMHLYVLND